MKDSHTNVSLPNLLMKMEIEINNNILVWAVERAGLWDKKGKGKKKVLVNIEQGGLFEE